MTITRLIARPMLASAFVAGAVHALQHTDEHAARAQSVIDRFMPALQSKAPVAVPTDPRTVVRVHAAVQLAAALALTTGKAPRTSAGVLALSTVPLTLTQRAFWNESEPQAAAAQRTEFLRDVSLLGGLLLAGVDTDGKPGLAWRARRAAKDVQREAKQFAREARREAKLAAAQLP
ncbi:MAG: DoxX family membrane protein [Nocardioides sp.]|uniref:DoxX family membrane protein n=1 Tax=Nocardioides sp. TaxID=35761 RepID=UPI003F0F31F0